jgi:hypothetical protein
MPAYVIAVAAQLLHFWEEFASGFYRLFPPVFGAPSWSSGGFLAFNLSWLVIFAPSTATPDATERATNTDARN